MLLFFIMLTKKITLFVGAFIAMSCVWAQPKIDTVSTIIPLWIGEEKPTIEISDRMVSDRSSVAHTNLLRKDIQKLNTGQDVPYLLRFTPSLVTTSDAGTGIGYTGLWIRGSDPTRINISLNGIPLNDAESQLVYWVNLPDLASGTSQIQIQRGVGSSTAGPGAFGGSIHVSTFIPSAKPQFIYQSMMGSYKSNRSSLYFHSGLNHGWALSGRLSQTQSAGYIDRGSAKLKGYQANIEKSWGAWKLQATAFGGNERTYQAWYGVPHELVYNEGTQALMDFAARNSLSPTETTQLLQSNRKYNYYTYPNQVDQYQQHHQQLHLRRHSESSDFHAALFHTRGAGYYEEQKLQTSVSNYGWNPFYANIGDTSLTETVDVVRRRWLDNHLWGGSFDQTWHWKQHQITVGGMAMLYQGKHSGEVISVTPNPVANWQTPYYKGVSEKTDNNIYAQYRFQNERWNIWADAQLRAVGYSTHGTDNELRNYDIKDNLLFFNPKLGASYSINTRQQLQGYVGYVSKEPNRNDYVDNAIHPKAEHMLDMEMAWSWNHPLARVKVNAYWMQYRDQLVLTGAVNDVGAPIRMNIPNSYRRGLEMELGHVLGRGWNIALNTTLSQNKIDQFDEVLINYTGGYEEQLIHHSHTDIAFSPRCMGSAILDKQWRGGWNWRWMSKWVGKQYMDNTGNDGRSISAYWVNDMQMSKTWKAGKLNGEIAFWVNNVLNREYVTNGYTYSYIYEQTVTERFYYPQATRNYMVTLRLQL
jgi:iron complex outermembrane receptor protein